MDKLDFTSGPYNQVPKEAQLPAILLPKIYQSSFKSIVNYLTRLRRTKLQNSKNNLDYFPCSCSTQVNKIKTIEKSASEPAKYIE